MGLPRPDPERTEVFQSEHRIRPSHIRQVESRLEGLHRAQIQRERHRGVQGGEEEGRMVGTLHQSSDVS